MNKLKLMTIIGSPTGNYPAVGRYKKMRVYFDQILVHTGQNYDYNLNQVFLRTWACARPTSTWTPSERTWARPSATLLQNPTL